MLAPPSSGYKLSTGAPSLSSASRGRRLPPCGSIRKAIGGGEQIGGERGAPGTAWNATRSVRTLRGGGCCGANRWLVG
ncbi:hypothetical protein B296_00034042 [Ensete ventricosum]|uniref:Uncharacterized protein n=1 Tax=Ensete ventricosum TaxID=4639 RepID=A0A426YVL0_ENSVE|nr:hypothetical protein B296_00034042 [Ensete ventricosum]